jgi:penicillin amidase
MPAVMLGHNAHISWSLTNAENQATLYYTEQTSSAHPDSYFWNGAWRPMGKVHYSIPVRGASSVPLTVDLTVHGPIMTVLKQTVSVTWMGDYPTNDLDALLALDRAGDFGGFKEALRGWKAPALNFVYADDRGHIGAVSPGYFPQTAKTSQPWLPMPGTGADDVVGTIPNEALPQVYDPPGHMIASTNQRPVRDDYPYYLGTSMNFDPGYRQSVIHGFQSGHQAMVPADFAELQNNVTDGLAQQLAPALLKSLDNTKLSGQERAASELLAHWNQAMDKESPAASVWWTFLDGYLHDVFQPWWDAKKVPVSTDKWTLDLKYSPIPLREALQHWTLNDPENAAFTPPGGAHRDAPQVMRAAFAEAVAKLAKQLGANPSAWTWGKLHSREIPAITGAPGLGYGPYSDGGDPWTVNAADGVLTSSFGPSWRMIAQWTGPGQVTATAIYPGGQSDTPTSPWYDNLVTLWRNKRYLPLPSTAGSAAWATWALQSGA